MNKKILPISILSLILFSFALLTFPQPTSAAMPGTFIYKDTGKKAPVPFSHKVHIDYGNTCSDCHTKIFQKNIGDADKEGAMTMKALKDGKFCGTCHDGEKAFSAQKNCGRCHLK